MIFAISLAFLEHAHNGPLEAKEGLQRMLRKYRFILLYAVGGLALPLGISAYLFFSGGFYAWILPITAVLLILGGFSLRNCLMKNGVQTYPWPY